MIHVTWESVCLKRRSTRYARKQLLLDLFDTLWNIKRIFLLTFCLCDTNQRSSALPFPRHKIKVSQ